MSGTFRKHNSSRLRIDVLLGRYFGRINNELHQLIALTASQGTLLGPRVQSVLERSLLKSELQQPQPQRHSACDFSPHLFLGLD